MPASDQGDRSADFENHGAVPVGGSPHGKPASWALVLVVIAAFAAGGAAVIYHLWVLFWVCAGIILLSVPVGKVIGIMNDTVSWGSNPAVVDNRRR